MGGILQSDAGSVYRGQQQDEDALSHFMAASEYGGAPTEVGVQSLIGNDNPRGTSSGAMNLKPPTSVPRKRQSEFKNSSASKNNESSSLPPKRRVPGAPEPKESKNYGSFLDGFKPPLRGESQGAHGSRDRISENKVGVLDSKNPNSFLRDRSAKRDQEDDS